MDMQENDGRDLSESEEIFRVISFYELIGILHNKRLRFACVDTMEDRNEAIASVLDSELAAAFNGAEFDPSNALNRHKKNMLGGFISCWTRSPANIAVWSVYSQNRDRVMVRTTIRKLRAALDHIDQNLLELGENILVSKTNVSGVDYVNLNDLKSRWSQMAKDMRDAREVDSKAGIIDGTENAVAAQLRLLKSNFRDLAEPYLKKDERYDYEREVRALFELKARKEEGSEGFDAGEIDFSSRTRAIEEQDNVPKQIEIPIGEDFIEEILLDGQMSDWQKDAIKCVLSKFDRTAKVSRAFSSLYE